MTIPCEVCIVATTAFRCRDYKLVKTLNLPLAETSGLGKLGGDEHP